MRAQTFGSVVRYLSVGLGAGAIVLSAAGAFGQGKVSPAPKPPSTGAPPLSHPPKGDLVDAKPTLSPGIAQKLKSNDEAQIKGALDEIRMVGKGASTAPTVPLIAELLDKGLSLGLTIPALETLGDLEVEASSASIAPYVVHRNVKVRQAATKALVRTRGAVAVKALRHALSDGDAMVRGVAASGLGSLKSHDAVPDLFIALDHRVAEAAAAIGQLCNPQECDAFSGRLGRQPFDVMTGGFDQILFRPTADVNDDGKVKVIGRVRELGTQEANKFLRDVQTRWPKTGSPRVKQSIDQGVQATGGGGAS